MSYEKTSSPLLQQVIESIRVRHYSIRTEKAYLDWIKRYIYFHNKRHPAELGEKDVSAFLTYLAVKRDVSPSTQNQALNALNFLYRNVLEQPLGDLKGIRAKKKQKLPVVLNQQEVSAILHNLNGSAWLAACLMYGSGLRLMECVRLRVMNLSFEHRAIYIIDGKGAKDRIVTLPDDLILPLQRHLESVRMIHDKDLAEGYGDVYLPYALTRKYPDAGKSWGWQYVFPAKQRSFDPRTDITRRHHFDEQALQRAVKNAVRKAGIQKLASCHTLRHYAEL